MAGAKAAVGTTGHSVARPPTKIKETRDDSTQQIRRHTQPAPFVGANNDQDSPNNGSSVALPLVNSGPEQTPSTCTTATGATTPVIQHNDADPASSESSNHSASPPIIDEKDTINPQGGVRVHVYYVYII